MKQIEKTPKQNSIKKFFAIKPNNIDASSELLNHSVEHVYSVEEPCPEPKVLDNKNTFDSNNCIKMINNANELIRSIYNVYFRCSIYSF